MLVINLAEAEFLSLLHFEFLEFVWGWLVILSVNCYLLVIYIRWIFQYFIKILGAMTKEGGTIFLCPLLLLLLLIASSD
jgi:hypothetical protein